MSGFGVYLHWPYCARICPYCDFNVYRPRGAQTSPLVEAIAADLAEHAARFGKREAASLYFGGGTPSLLGGGELARLIEAAERAFGLSPVCEITLECNPEDASRFAEHAGAGVNRFSIGVQALDDAALKALGRAHDAAAALAAVEAAAATGERVSIDLIYAREGQGLAEWSSELRRALKLPVEHVSLYQLTIEEGTALARRAMRGQFTAPDADTAAALYEATQEACDAAGFPAYEISNHARTPAARSAHNLVYWRSQDWVGVGPGAHGRVTHQGVRLALEAQSRPSDYVDAVREHGVGWISEARLAPEEAGDEMLVMGLRIDEGVELERVAALRGRRLNQDALAWLEEQGLVVVERGRVRLSRPGRLLADKIAAELAV